jgi:hypothetical protein
MARRWHYLQENHRSETIHSCIWYDCETTPELLEDGTKRHNLEFGWAAYRRRLKGGAWSEPEWFRFVDWLEFWSWVVRHLRTGTCLYIWAHNQAFDLLASHAFEGLALLGGRMEDAIVDAPPLIIRYEFGRSKVVLVDTLNIWRMSLETMGEHTGLAKLDMPRQWTHSADDDIYCRRDVEIIMKAVTEWADFLDAHDLGKFCLTIASQAMQTFRHRYLDDSILIDGHDEALKIARACYHGGRVECFYIGPLTGPLYLLDITSLYPAMMAAHRFPVRLRGVYHGVTPTELRDLLADYCVCAHVTVRTRSPFCPLIKDRKLLFPVGVFDADLSSPELEYALEHEDLVSIQACAVYEPGTPFVHFVEDLYQHKMLAARHGKLVEAGHWKLLLNSFSGKWGQSGVRWRTLRRARSNAIRFARVFDVDTRELTLYRSFNGLVQVRETSRESAHSHPAIAAHITAYGRMRLWALIGQIAPKDRFYCDTDSVLISKDGLKQVKEPIQDEILGGLRLVGEFGDGHVYGAKDYVLDSVRTCKGIRDQAVEINPGEYWQQKWIGFRGALAHGWLDGPRTTSVVKHLRRGYTKGTTLASGYVLPFHV